jgi:fatty-acid peroxygenase
MPATVVVGPEGAELFYDEARLRRADALPGPVRHTLFGDGGVQTLDDEDHRRRKAMFMAVVTPASVGELAALTAAGWEATTARWCQEGRPVVVFDEARDLLCRCAAAWVGLEVGDDELPALARDLATRVDGFGSPGPAHLRARLARHRTERRMEAEVERARRGGAPDGSPLAAVAAHRDADGALLPARVAAVEVVNLVRPTTAIAWYVAFATLALHQHPGWVDQLRTGGHDLLRAFVHEVRRTTPFAPFLGARARRDLTWHDHDIPEGRLVLLDVHGSNHLGRTWGDPEAFRPERFLGREPGPFELIPQGGGSHDLGHRCAGERVTIALLEAAVVALVGLAWHLPPQDLRVPLRRMPTRPRSGMVLDRVRPARA